MKTMRFYSFFKQSFKNSLPSLSGRFQRLPRTCPCRSYQHVLFKILPGVMFFLFFLLATSGSALAIKNSSETEELERVKITNFHVNPATGRIHDQTGRERVFHGLNVVVKGSPWHPVTDGFDSRLSFSDEDVVMIKEWGMNVVRLAVMWPGVEPKRGQINYTYLGIMQSIVAKLHLSGIYTLLEFHQDLFSSQFCGEGVPAWLLEDASSAHWQDYAFQNKIQQDQEPTDHQEIISGSSQQNTKLSGERLSTTSTTILEASKTAKNNSNCRFNRQDLNYSISVKKSNFVQYPPSFPEPLGRRWPSKAGQDGWEPSADQCGRHSWFWYYFSYAVSRAFQDLYDNQWGWADLLGRYWTVVAGAFRQQPGVLGYELINEPWPGDIFRNPLLLLPGVADAKNLANFYEKLLVKLRSADSERIVFLETVTYDNLRCGFSSIPGGKQFQNRTILSYHYYKPPNFTPRQAFSERLRESKRLGCGAMLTEFFVSNKIDQRIEKNPNPKNSDEGSKSRATYGRNNASSHNPETDLTITSKKRSHNLRISFADNTYATSDHQFNRNERSIQEAKLRDSVDEVLTEADAHVQSWIGWEYKAYFNKTGSVIQESLFNEEGNVNQILARKLARTYPQAVHGHIKSFSFQPSTSEFYLSYVAGSLPSEIEDPEECTTEIFVHRPFYYPSGLQVDVDTNCTSIRETETLIIISHTRLCVGTVIDVRIRKCSVIS